MGAPGAIPVLIFTHYPQLPLTISVLNPSVLGVYLYNDGFVQLEKIKPDSPLQIYPCVGGFLHEGEAT